MKTSKSILLYDSVAEQAARNLTMRYSTSFGMASRLFDVTIRSDIYNIYGLVRIADEIVDTYRGADAAELLLAMEHEVYAAIDRGYSRDLIIHAFQLTARKHGVGRELLHPFFVSMAMDLTTAEHDGYDKERFQRYVYGSAEVVGLMCLRVFTEGDDAVYGELGLGARALGSAYQKVNFLRDLAEDHTVLNRNYFPELQSEPLTEASKELIIADIEKDFAKAKNYIDRLPTSARSAVDTSYRYYSELLDGLRRTSAADIADVQCGRVRINNGRKAMIFGAAMLHKRLKLPHKRS